jgi:hypothetical protein
MRQTPGEWVWCSGGRCDKRRAQTGTRGRLDDIVMGSGVIAQEAWGKRRGPPERASVQNGRLMN